MFITGDAGSAELNQSLETSELTVLRKPFDIETLLQVCRQKMGADREPARGGHSASAQRLGSSEIDSP